MKSAAFLSLSVVALLAGSAQSEAPRAADPRLEVSLFAAAPDIVQPIHMAFDRQGRLLVIESHTHFRPKDYHGPKTDRIRIVEDSDGDGKADRFTTFFEGTQATMDIALGPDGWVYVATRNEILRLRDSRGDGKADVKQRVVFLDTKGNYPHNGLSGLSFDFRGNLTFGLGENLGATYKLISADGTTLSGGGEGGGIFECTADGKSLHRVATGFWNPFGTCRDVYGHLFAVDNDPDAMPPCRLVHVVEGGDYGFQFRYGRSGRHLFQAWNGELPGTLPYVCGVGEAPCTVVSYESDGLPDEYRGSLLVTSWADHRVERYVPRERGASFTSERKAFVQGGKDFRPVGLAVAPDGSLFISDWVLSNYELHGRGAIWHIHCKQATKPDRPKDPHKALLSAHRPLREAAARELPYVYLSKQLENADPRVRATCLLAMLPSPLLVGSPSGMTVELRDVQIRANRDSEVGIRALAVHYLAAHRPDVRRFLAARQPASVRREAIAGLTKEEDLQRLVPFLTDADPYLRHAAVIQLSHAATLLAAADGRTWNDPRQRVALLLAHRAAGRAKEKVVTFLADPDEDVRFLAAKWIADEKLVQYRPQIIAALKDRKLNVRMYSAYSTALARIDNQDVNEAKMADYFFDRLTDDASPPALRVKALQLIPPNHARLTLDLLGRLLHQADPALQLEAVRTLCDHPSSKRFTLLLAAARDPHLATDVRAQALVGLAEKAPELRDDLLRLARSDEPSLRDEALRALIRTPLTAAQRGALEELARQRADCHALVSRVLGKPFAKDRPQPDDLKAWLKRLDGPADVAAGRRIFAHPKLGGCYRCHRVEGRGREVGPDLDTIGRTERRSILESILQPSNAIAPAYQTWQLEMKDGRVLTGLLLMTVLDEYTYVDTKGEAFKVNTRDVLETHAVLVSIMPAGLPDLLTDQELRDLLAYLGSRR
jgi:putative membrane-bound dehydrogenase-like protein